MPYDTIVIGAGAAGLAAGLRLALAGKKILLLERQPLAGGLATGFSRRGFIFESSLHCVDGLGPQGEVRQFLDECGLGSAIEYIELKDFSRQVYPEHDFVVDFNIERFAELMKKNFPAQAKGVRALFRALDRFWREFDAFSNTSMPSALQLLLSPFLYRSIIRSSCLTLEQFISKYIKDEKAKSIFAGIWGYLGLPPSALSSLYYLIVLRGFYAQPTSYVKGGYPGIFKAMLEKMKSAQAEVKFNSSVVKIAEAKSHLRVLTDRGEEFTARSVISDANAIDTLINFPDSEKIKSFYAKRLAVMEKSISGFQVYLGLNTPAAKLGMNHAIITLYENYNHDQNYRYCLEGDYARGIISLVDHAQIDPSLAPAGKGQLLIFVLDAYKNWRDLPPDEYRRKKVEAAQRLIQRAQRVLPGLAESIEFMEVATPRTIERFGASPEGALYGFSQRLNQAGLNRLSQKTAIRGLYLAGAWTYPGGGVHGCFVSGREAAEAVLKFLG